MFWVRLKWDVEAVTDFPHLRSGLLVVLLRFGGAAVWYFVCERNMAPQQSLGVRTDRSAITFKPSYPLKYQPAIPETSEARGFV